MKPYHEGRVMCLLKAEMWTTGPPIGDWFKCSFAKLTMEEISRRRLTIKSYKTAHPW